MPSLENWASVVYLFTASVCEKVSGSNTRANYLPAKETERDLFIRLAVLYSIDRYISSSD